MGPLMLRAVAVLIFYLICLGYITMDFQWRNSRGVLKTLHLRGWQESDAQELVWLGIFAIAMVAVAVFLSKEFS